MLGALGSLGSMALKAGLWGSAFSAGQSALKSDFAKNIMTKGAQMVMGGIPQPTPQADQTALQNAQQQINNTNTESPQISPTPHQDQTPSPMERAQPDTAALEEHYNNNVRQAPEIKETPEYAPLPEQAQPPAPLTFDQQLQDITAQEIFAGMHLDNNLYTTVDLYQQGTQNPLQSAGFEMPALSPASSPSNIGYIPEGNSFMPQSPVMDNGMQNSSNPYTPILSQGYDQQFSNNSFQMNNMFDPMGMGMLGFSPLLF